MTHNFQYSPLYLQWFNSKNPWQNTIDQLSSKNRTLSLLPSSLLMIQQNDSEGLQLETSRHCNGPTPPSLLHMLNKPVHHVLLCFFGSLHGLFIVNLVPHSPSMCHPRKYLHETLDLYKKDMELVFKGPEIVMGINHH